MRLGHVRRHRHGHLGPLGHVLAPDAQHALAGLDDADDVLVLLGGQADHEVELHAVPAAPEHPLGALGHVRLGDVLVDHVAHALGPGLGREGEAGDAHLRHLVEELLAQAVGAQRRHRQRHLLVAQLARHLAHQRRDAGVVGGRQAGQRGLVVAGLVDAVDDALDDRLGRALAHRAVDHPGLAEAAALGAAARDLDAGAIEHRLGVRHRRVAGERVLVEVGHEAAPHPRRHAIVDRLADHLEPGRLVDLGAVERRHVDRIAAGQLGQGVEPRPAGPPRRRPLEHQTGQLLLRLADEEGVEERRQRLRVGRGRAAGDDQRIAVGPVGGAQRHAAQVEQGQDVGEGELELQREADDVEVAERRLRLERAERQGAGAQLRLHVDPRGEAALARDARVGVEDRVEDLGPQVRHADLVEIGEGQHHAGGHLGRVLDHRLVLAAQVAGRDRDAVDEVGVDVAHGAPSYQPVSPGAICTSASTPKWSDAHAPPSSRSCSTTWASSTVPRPSLRRVVTNT